jgi:hypothetical protein
MISKVCPLLSSRNTDEHKWNFCQKCRTTYIACIGTGNSKNTVEIFLRAMMSCAFTTYYLHQYSRFIHAINKNSDFKLRFYSCVMFAVCNDFIMLTTL